MFVFLLVCIQTEPWCCAEAAELDSCANGEVLCQVHVKGHIMSSYSEGIIKVSK